MDASWQYVKNIYTNNDNESLGGKSHDLAHLIGDLFYQDRGLDGIADCDPTFAFGCYHGLTEAAFATSLEQLPDAAGACSDAWETGTGPWASCIHGIGHGVATYFDAVELAEALTTCDLLHQGSSFCYDGVFMEFSFSAPPSYFSQEKPLFPCSAIKEKYHFACGRNQLSVMQHRLMMPAEKAIEACLLAADDITSGCLDAYGFSVAQNAQSNAGLISSQCGIVGDALGFERCVTAAAGELIFQNFSGWQDTAPATCAMLSAEGETRCLARLAELQLQYSRE